MSIGQLCETATQALIAEGHNPVVIKGIAHLLPTIINVVIKEGTTKQPVESASKETDITVLIQEQFDGSGFTLLRAYFSDNAALIEADYDMMHQGADSSYNYRTAKVPVVDLLLQKYK